MTKNTYLLTIDDGRVWLFAKGQRLHPVTDMASFAAWWEAETAQHGTAPHVRVTSLMDFPHEYTDDPAVIALARALRPSIPWGAAHLQMLNGHTTAS